MRRFNECFVVSKCNLTVIKRHGNFSGNLDSLWITLISDKWRKDWKGALVYVMNKGGDCLYNFLDLI